MKYKDTRAVNNMTLHGMVKESYIKYAAERDQIEAKELRANIEKLKAKFPTEDFKNVSMSRLIGNVDRLKKAISMKEEAYNKLKRVCHDIHTGHTSRSREVLLLDRDMYEKQMTSYTSEILLAREALRKTVQMHPQKLMKLLQTENEPIPNEILTTDEVKAIADEVKLEGTVQDGTFSPLEDQAVEDEEVKPEDTVQDGTFSLLEDQTVEDEAKREDIVQDDTLSPLDSSADAWCYTYS